MMAIGHLSILQLIHLQTLKNSACLECDKMLCYQWPPMPDYSIFRYPKPLNSIFRYAVGLRFLSVFGLGREGLGRHIEGTFHATLRGTRRALWPCWSSCKMRTLGSRSTPPATREAEMQVHPKARTSLSKNQHERLPVLRMTPEATGSYRSLCNQNGI